jgi:hypothetical protein
LPYLEDIELRDGSRKISPFQYPNASNGLITDYILTQIPYFILPCLEVPPHPNSPSSDAFAVQALILLFESM